MFSIGTTLCAFLFSFYIGKKEGKSILDFGAVGPKYSCKVHILLSCRGLKIWSNW